MFEGEGDTFLSKGSKEMHARQSPSITQENDEGPIPMREGDAFGGINPHQSQF
jgi:hypothetical protein